jgi:hypothetical protein
MKFYENLHTLLDTDGIQYLEMRFNYLQHVLANYDRRQMANANLKSLSPMSQQLLFL